MRDASGWRHVYTWTPRGLRGRPGFQTVACAAPLAGDRRAAVERLVAGLRPPADGRGGDRRPVLALQPLPTDLGRCVLTRAVPTGAAADGRPGNYWAESVVVPEGWLAAAAWDLAAAFGAVEWWGPRDPEALAGDDELPPETLPPLAPGPADRLARIPQIVPDTELRRALFEVTAWQGHDGGREEPIHVVAAPERSAGELPELVLLLPLTLPLAARTRGEDAGRRCLRLATVVEPGALVGADLLGVPAAALDAARGARGVVVDLGGGVPPPDSGDPAARAWARRVDEAIAAGAWDELAAAVEDDRSTTTERRETTMARQTGGGRRTGAEEKAAAPGGEMAGREGLWRQREQGEAAGSELLAALRRDHEQLLETMRELVGEQQRKLEAELDRQIGEAAERLRAASENAMRDLRQQADEVIDSVRSARSRAETQVREAQHAAIDDLHAEVSRARAAVEADRRRGAREIAGYAGLAPRETAGGDDARGVDDWDEAAAPAAAAGRRKPDLGKKPRPGSQHRPGMVERLRRARTGRGEPAADGDWSRAALYGIVTLAVLLAALALWLTRDRWAGDGTAEEPDRTEQTAAAPEALREDLLTRLQDPALGGRLVAASWATESLRPEAAAAWLDVTLAHRELGAAESCALLQAALRRRLVEVGKPPIAVDGDCGPGTQRNLAAEARAVGCTETAFEAQAACFLERRVARAEREDCRPAWPYARGCRWRAAEADRFLELVRDAAAVPALAGGAWRPERGELPAGLTGDDAARLLQLAYLADQAAQGETPSSAPRLDRLTADELQSIAGFLDRLPAAAAALGAPAPTPAAARPEDAAA